MTENLLDIDYLKSLDIAPKWFGLGFIQLKLSDTRRMHFWHPDLKPDDAAFMEEYHDHRYDFVSEVLVGQIDNHIATVEATAEKSPYGQFEVCCSGGGQEFQWPVWLTETASFTTPAGHDYFLHRDAFHRVTAHSCVTLQTRSETIKEKARVIQKMDRPSDNPFDTHIETDRLWGYIADLLPRNEKPGYHLGDIPKGVLGEPSKIMEEAHEFMDAYNQNARVMELVELSDMLGAVEAFLDRHHPGYTLEDLKTMSDITKRAFENGRR